MKDKILKIIKTDWFQGTLILLVLIIFILSIYILPSKTINTEKGTLTIVATDLKNQKGNLIFCLYKTGPLTNLENIAEVREMTITSDQMTAVFADIPFKEYAVFILHDENKNRIPDPGPDGTPIEGMGISGMKIDFTEKPDFERAKFNFNQKNLELTIPVLYQ